MDDAQGDDDKEDYEHDNDMNESSFTKTLLNKSRKVLFKIRAVVKKSQSVEPIKNIRFKKKK